MKNKKYYFFACIMLALVIANLYIGFALETDTVEDLGTSSIVDKVNINGILEGKTDYRESIQNDAGQVLNVYSDENYLYYVTEADNRVAMVSLQADQMEKLSEMFSKGQINIISDEKAEEIMYEVIGKVFPEYSVTDLCVSFDNVTGSSIESFRFYIEEVIDDNVINVASVSLAANGQISSVSGSHNTVDLFEMGTATADATSEKCSVSKDDLPDIIARYVTDNLVAMESERMVDGDVYSEETVIASEGMLLPDGVNIGDTFAVKRLPEYRIYCENAEDIHIVESARVIHKGVIAWEVKFTLDTSWGEVDS